MIGKNLGRLVHDFRHFVYVILLESREKTRESVGADKESRESIWRVKCYEIYDI